LSACVLEAEFASQWETFLFDARHVTTSMVLNLIFGVEEIPGILTFKKL
jgi:hypothetical protein